MDIERKRRIAALALGFTLIPGVSALTSCAITNTLNDIHDNAQKARKGLETADTLIQDSKDILNTAEVGGQPIIDAVKTADTLGKTAVTIIKDVNKTPKPDQ